MNKKPASCEAQHVYSFRKGKDPVCIHCGEFYAVGLIMDLYSTMGIREKKQLQERLRKTS